MGPKRPGKSSSGRDSPKRKKQKLGSSNNQTQNESLQEHRRVHNTRTHGGVGRSGGLEGSTIPGSTQADSTINSLPSIARSDDGHVEDLFPRPTNTQTNIPRTAQPGESVSAHSPPLEAGQKSRPKASSRARSPPAVPFASTRERNE